MPESKSSDIKICSDDINVDVIDKVELLGVIIDNKLHFKDHISKIAKKVGKQLDVLSRLKNNNNNNNNNNTFIYIALFLFLTNSALQDIKN